MPTATKNAPAKDEKPLIKEDSLPVLPLNDRVLVEIFPSNMSPGGVVLPEKQCKSGIVRAIGLGVAKEFVADHDTQRNSRGLKLGDKVYLTRGTDAGAPFEHKGRNYLMVQVNFIGAIIQVE
jgi:co-chaperonin GroES (HSP10)